MLACTEGPRSGDLPAANTPPKAPPSSGDVVGWQRLRLFGNGRRRGAFAAGVERRNEL